MHVRSPPTPGQLTPAPAPLQSPEAAPTRHPGPAEGPGRGRCGDVIARGGVTLMGVTDRHLKCPQEGVRGLFGAKASLLPFPSLVTCSWSPPEPAERRWVGRQ